MSKYMKLLIVLSVVVVLSLAVVLTASAVGGAAFTTFNAAADGAGKDVCKNSAINCNIYGAKEYVWLNGGPDANHLKPDGWYFFAVLVPGGQPNPNDGGAKNLSDDYDAYTNRTFRTEGGEVVEYKGTHDMDSGTAGNPKVDGLPPYIRLFPYADTTNPGGVYIMSICYLGPEGVNYPVNPRDCKYDAFKVKPGKMTYQFGLAGMKFLDKYADGAFTTWDYGLPDWEIAIKGTGPDGDVIDVTVVTGADGAWELWSKVYTYIGSAMPGPVHLEVCEVLKDGWYQSAPTPACYTLDFTPAGLDYFDELDFGNYQKVDVTACKVRDLDGVEGGETVPVPGWEVSLTKDGEVVDTQFTGADGCYTWTDLMPGIKYDVHEGDMPGWFHMGDPDYIFEKAASGKSYSHTFINAVYEGCTPGFWQGGSAGGQAGGQWLWNEVNDPQWKLSGGMGWNPYIWTTYFNDFFTPYAGLNGFTMMDLINTGGGPDDFQKAGRSLVAAYLNASWGITYPYTTGQLHAMWDAAVASGDFLALHTELDAANNAYYRDEPPDHCPISASGW